MLEFKTDLLALRDEWENEIPDRPVHSVRDKGEEHKNYKCRKNWFFVIVGDIDNFRRFFWDQIDEDIKSRLLTFHKKMTDHEQGGFWDSHEKMETKTGLADPRITPEDIKEGDEIIDLMLKELEKIER